MQYLYIIIIYIIKHKLGKETKRLMLRKVASENKYYVELILVNQCKWFIWFNEIAFQK